MKIIETEIPGVLVIEPDVFGDHRGWFCETWNRQKLHDAGIDADFVQDNQSYTKARGTLRGLHFQQNPMSQAKLVRVVRGAVLDVAVDLRKGSPTYLKHVIAELSAENKRQFFIPKGFAHGFLTLTDDVEFVYKVDAPYAPDCDRSVRFDDPEIGVDWPCEEPILSDKDKKAPLLRDSDCNFVFET